MIEDNIIFQKDVFCGCACECFVRIQVNEYDWDNEVTERIMSVNYLQSSANDFQHRSGWRQRIKRAWRALRNKDWLPGFEFYNTEVDADYLGEFVKAIEQASLAQVWGTEHPFWQKMD